jgi:hypothetical protein
VNITRYLERMLRTNVDIFEPLTSLFLHDSTHVDILCEIFHAKKLLETFRSRELILMIAHILALIISQRHVAIRFDEVQAERVEKTVIQESLYDLLVSKIKENSYEVLVSDTIINRESARFINEDYQEIIELLKGAK